MTNASGRQNLQHKSYVCVILAIAANVGAVLANYMGDSLKEKISSAQRDLEYHEQQHQWANLKYDLMRTGWAIVATQNRPEEENYDNSLGLIARRALLAMAYANHNSFLSGATREVGASLDDRQIAALAATVGGIDELARAWIEEPSNENHLKLTEKYGELEMEGIEYERQLRLGIKDMAKRERLWTSAFLVLIVIAMVGNIASVRYLLLKDD